MPKPRFTEEMTVGQMIAILEEFDEETPVVFAYNYGDHWDTKVVECVVEIDEHGTSYSEYHRQDKLDENSEDTAIVIFGRSALR